jgi:flagellar motor protein MotB
MAPAPPPTPLNVAEAVLARQADEFKVQVLRTAPNVLLLRAAGDAAFASGSSMPSRPFQQFLEQVASVLAANPGLAAKVYGHTDSSGRPQANERLSTARARNTVNRLVRLGVQPGRLSSEGKGPREPIAGNDTAEGRATNRRVEIFLEEAGH